MNPCICQDLGGDPTQGYATDHVEADPKAIKRDMGLTSSRDRDAGIEV